MSCEVCYIHPSLNLTQNLTQKLIGTDDCKNVENILAVT